MYNIEKEVNMKKSIIKTQYDQVVRLIIVTLSFKMLYTTSQKYLYPRPRKNDLKEPEYQEYYALEQPS